MDGARHHGQLERIQIRRRHFARERRDRRPGFEGRRAADGGIMALHADARGGQLEGGVQLNGLARGTRRDIVIHETGGTAAEGQQTGTYSCYSKYKRRQYTPIRKRHRC
jgi:hypothetical protein